MLGCLAALGLRPAFGQEATRSDAPAVCRIGINIEDLYDLDMARDTFGAILWVWSVCPTPELGPLDTIAFPTAAAGLNVGPVTTVPVASGGQYASRRVQGTFRFNWDMRYLSLRQATRRHPDRRDTGRRGSPAVRGGHARSRSSPPTSATASANGGFPTCRSATSVSEEASTYGLPGAQGARYARIEATVTLERAQFMTFLKLTSGVYAAVFIAFLSFFYDPNDRGSFGGKLGLLVGVLFAVLVNLRAADTSIGDPEHMTLVTGIHLVTLLFIVVLAILALRDRRRVERGATVRHPDWPALAVIGGVYLVLIGGLIARAALS